MLVIVAGYIAATSIASVCYETYAGLTSNMLNVRSGVPPILVRPHAECCSAADKCLLDNGSMLNRHLPSN